MAKKLINLKKAQKALEKTCKNWGFTIDCKIDGDTMEATAEIVTKAFGDEVDVDVLIMMDTEGFTMIGFEFGKIERTPQVYELFNEFNMDGMSLVAGVDPDDDIWGVAHANYMLPSKYVAEYTDIVFDNFFNDEKVAERIKPLIALTKKKD